MNRVLLIALLLLCAFPKNVDAQILFSDSGINVTAMFSSEDGTMLLERNILDEFKTQLKERNIPVSLKSPTRLFFNARKLEIENRTRIVLSISIMQALPEEVIAFGAKNEAFYMSWQAREDAGDAKDLPPEGKEIREYVSGEWLGQFYNLVDEELLIFSPDELESTLDRYLRRFLKV